MDLADLPPAKGKVRPLSTPEGSVFLVHAHDFMQQKWLIPDLATLVQSFSLYTAVVCSKTRVPNSHAKVHVTDNKGQSTF